MGIIAVLLALLLSVFARVREAGNAVVCASNLRQLGHGISRYMLRYNGYLPPSDPPLSPPWEYQRWPALLVGTRCIELGTADL